MTFSLLWKIHAVLMGISFLSMAGGVIISLLKKRIKGFFILHKNLGITAACTGITGIIIAMVMVQVSGGHHLTSLHSYLGALTALLLISTPLLMLMKRTRGKKPFRVVHRISGFLTLFLMALTIFLGLNLVGIISLFY